MEITGLLSVLLLENPLESLLASGARVRTREAPYLGQGPSLGAANGRRSWSQAHGPSCQSERWITCYKKVLTGAAGHQRVMKREQNSFRVQTDWLVRGTLSRGQSRKTAPPSGQRRENFLHTPERPFVTIIRRAQLPRPRSWLSHRWGRCRPLLRGLRVMAEIREGKDLLCYP